MDHAKRPRTECPMCGGPKGHSSTTCMSCRDKMHYAEDANIVPRPCRRCERVLPGDQFRLRKVSDRKGGGFRRESICLDCSRADARRRARARHEAGHPWTNKLYQLRHFARRIWNVDPDDLVAYVSSHDGLCEICGRTANEVHKDGRRLAVDHSNAGVRGLLCHHCNVGIGHFEDDPERLRRAISYLARGPVIHARNADPA